MYLVGIDSGSGKYRVVARHNDLDKAVETATTLAAKGNHCMVFDKQPLKPGQGMQGRWKYEIVDEFGGAA